MDEFTLKRRVEYFRTDGMYADGKSAAERQARFLAVFENLDRPSRRLMFGDGRFMSIKLNEVKRNSTGTILAVVGHLAFLHGDNLPNQEDEEENESPLNLGTNKLKFSAHFAWANLPAMSPAGPKSPDPCGFLAIEYERSAPKAAQLHDLLESKGHTPKVDVKVTRIADANAVEVFKAASEITNIEIAIASKFGDHAQTSNLLKAIPGAQALAALHGSAPPGFWRQEVRFKAPRRQAAPNATPTINLVEALLELEAVETLNVQIKGRPQPLRLRDAVQSDTIEVQRHHKGAKSVSRDDIFHRLKDRLQQRGADYAKSRGYTWKSPFVA